MSILMIISFPLAFLIHDLEEILVQHKWMSAHKEDLLRRFPRLQPMIHHLSSLSSKAFTIAVLEELVLLLLATAYYLVGGPYALEIWYLSRNGLWQTHSFRSDWICSHSSNYPITTSSTIIKTKPMAKPMVLRLEC